MPLSEETKVIQKQFAEVCRTGQITDIANLSEGRALVYRNLVRNGIEDTLIRAYPIAYSRLKKIDSLWQNLIDGFISHGKFETPELWRMPKMFLEYVRQYEFINQYNVPFIHDLLEFEWAEIEVFMQPDLIDFNSYLEGLKAKLLIAINPEHKILKLKYPVFKKVADNYLNCDSDFTLLIFRHPDTRLVRFVEISPIFEKIITHLKGLILSREDFIEKSMAFIQDAPFIKETYSNCLKHINLFIDQSIGEGFIYYSCNKDNN